MRMRLWMTTYVPDGERVASSSSVTPRSASFLWIRASPTPDGLGRSRFDWGVGTMALVQVQTSGGEGVQPGVSAAAAQTSGTIPRWQVVAASFAAIGVAWLVSITINAA